MSDLYLIAHKVRGEPAFDVACRAECAECHGTSAQEVIDGPCICNECDSTGYWWIIPTSGHRAYPWQFWDLDNLGANSDIGFCPDLADPMPEGLPDHYRTRAEPKFDLIKALGLRKPPPTKVLRRI